MTNFFKKFLIDDQSKEILTKGFSFLVLRLFGAVVGYIFTIYISNKYGADTYGLLALSFSIFLIVGVFGRLGLDTNIVKFFSQDKNDTEAGILYKSLLLTFIASIVFSYLVFFFRETIVLEFYKEPKPELLDYLPWILAALPFWNIAMICSSFFRAKKQSMLYSFMNFSSRFLFSLIILVIIAEYSDNPILIVKAHFLAIIITAFLCIFLVHRKLSFTSKTSVKSIPFLKESFPMLLSTSILIIMSMVDTQIMGVYESKTNVGIYTVAIKISALTIFTLQAINSILGPKIAYSFAENEKSMQNLVSFSTKINFFITLSIGLVIIVFNQTILGFFGEEFKQGKLVLIILCIGQIINAISGSVGIILQMIGKQKVQQNFVLMALILNIILTFILTPRYGGEGAAISTVISMAFWNIGCAIYLKRKMGLITYFYFIKRNKK